MLHILNHMVLDDFLFACLCFVGLFVSFRLDYSVMPKFHFICYVLFVAGGADVQAAVKPADVSSQKSTRGVPKAPVTNAPAVISSTMAPSTPVKGHIF